MTNTTVPTDAELLELADACEIRDVLRNGLIHEAELLGFARAVLARWGATAPVSGEPVMWAFKYSDGTWHDASATEHSVGMRPLYDAAPPAPEVRVPLSIEEVEAILARWDYAIHSDRVRYIVRDIVRETERAHSITAKEPT